MNTKWRFHKLTNLTAFAASLNDVPIGCKDAVLPEPLWVTAQPTASRLKRTRDNQITATCVSLCCYSLFAGKSTIGRRNEFLTCSSVEWTDSGPVSSRKSKWKTFQLLKICYYSFFLSMISILKSGNIIAELARGRVQKHENTVRLLRYNIHICYVSNNNAAFQSFRCPNCDTFLNKTSNLERNLTCSERVRKVCPKNVYQTREALFDKLHFFGIWYINEQIIFKKLAVFEFESICVPEETSKTPIQQNGI